MAREATRRRKGRAFLECADLALRVLKSPEINEESPTNASRIRMHLDDLEANYRYRGERLLSPPVQQRPELPVLARPYWRGSRARAYALFVQYGRAADWTHLKIYGRSARGMLADIMHELDILQQRSVRLATPPRVIAQEHPGRGVGRPRRHASFDLEDSEEL